MLTLSTLYSLEAYDPEAWASYWAALKKIQQTKILEVDEDPIFFSIFLLVLT